MTKTNANDLAWAKAFDSLDLFVPIRRQGWVDVTARALREFREPRLMAKIDHSNNRPKIFQEEDLNILALSSSHYRIGKFNIFHELPEATLPQTPITRVELPVGIESLAFKGLTSESAVVTSSHAAGILDAFCGDDLLLTSFGRMRTPSFSFSINGKGGFRFDLQVDSATIEIDAAYENTQALYILEVKNHRPNDFNMRQLYYPFRTWSSKIKKPVQCVFLTFSNDVYDLHEISFADSTDFSSGVIGKRQRFMVAEGTVRRQDLEELARRISGERDWNLAYRARIPFPQADSFARVVDLVAILIDQPKSVGDLSAHYGFDARQSDYYYNAARYLGLASSFKDDIAETELREATPEAIKLFEMPYRSKFLALAEQVLRIQPINAAFTLAESTPGKLDPRAVQEIFACSAEARELGYSASTIDRRSQTIIAWVNWLDSIAED